MAAPYVFRFVGDSLANLSASYVESASSGIISAFGPVVLTAVTLFITVYGVLVIANKIQSPVSDLLVKLGKFAIIAFFALNAGSYTTYVIGAIQGLETGLIAAMSSSGTTSPESTYQLLDEAMGRAGGVAAQAFDKAGEKSTWDIAGMVPWFFTGFVIFTGAGAYLLVGGAMLIMAKFALGLMFAIGPLFIIALMFPATAGFFDRWLSQTLTYVFTIVLLAAVLSMGITIFNHLITNVVYDDESNVMFVGLVVCVVSLVLAVLTFQVAGMASGIAGGAGMAALALRQLVSPVTAPAAAIAGRINPVSNRLDPRTGIQTSSSRLEHFAMGRSVLSPNSQYRNALRDRLRSSFNAGGNSIRRGR